MKKGLIITTTLAAVTSVAFTGDVPETAEILVPGVGIENYVTLGVSTRNEILVKYGSGYKEIKNYSSSGSEKQLVSRELNYSSQGISFFFPAESDTLMAIHVKSPFKAKTTKNIVLGESTLENVESAYGKQDIYEADNLMFEEYPGIRFYVNGGKGVTEEQLIKRKIVKIAIIKMQ